ncbi:hypothetical protein BHUM_00706 [Candidatus Burkholderia humilis]|nr:hypothetical protein BHUM_00706 [Candidatus Burkholderia humilis]
MKGSQLTLYAANQRHRKLKKKVVDWVLDEIAQAGIHGATVTDVLEGIDAHGRYHSSRFFELIDQPVAVMVAASDAQIDALIVNLKAAGVPLFLSDVRSNSPRSTRPMKAKGNAHERIPADVLHGAINGTAAARSANGCCAK